MSAGARLAAGALWGVVFGAAVGGSASSHNGYGIAPIFSEPFGLFVVTGEEPLVLRWTARESHADQLYRLRAQTTDFPPTPSPPSALRGGELLATLPADALAYEVALDLSTLASGAWRLYADFDEPPFCVELEQAPALVVIRRAGEPPPYGVLVTSPLVDSPIVDTTARLSVEAIASAAPRVTIEAGEIVRDPAFPELALCVEFTWTKLFTVASDLAMKADPSAGLDRFRLDLDWDTREVPDGAYLLRVTTTDAAGVAHVTWARRWINVEHLAPEPPVEPGPEPSPEPGSEVAEVADGPVVPMGDTGGCRSGGVGPWAMFGLALASLGRRRAIVLAG